MQPLGLWQYQSACSPLWSGLMDPNSLFIKFSCFRLQLDLLVVVDFSQLNQTIGKVKSYTLKGVSYSQKKKFPPFVGVDSYGT